MDGLRRAPGVVLTLVLAMSGAAEAQILTGSVIGTVKDVSGGLLPGVTATIASPALPAGPQTIATNEQGEYRFSGLPPGTYALMLSLQGFANCRRRVSE
jgi:hypothetical protein